MRAVHLDCRCRDLAHIHNIGFQRGVIDERGCARRLKGSLCGTRYAILCGDMEMPDVDLCPLAEDDAVRIDDIDIVAALDLAIDVRGVRTRDDIQIVVRLIAAIILNGLTVIDGVIAPVNDVVLCSRRDCGRHRIRTLNIDARRIVMLARRSCISDLWNQKSARHACDEGIAYPLR